MKWIELSVETHAEAVDAVAEVFRRHETGGVAIEQPVDSGLEGEETPVFTGLPVVKAYLPATPETANRERRIQEELWHLQAFDLSPVGPVRRREIDEEDWANAWKEHFHPLKIGRVVIKPSWCEWNAATDEIVVELDPGMAFGTGLHPTTRLTLAALTDRVRPEMRVLDLGTGSGILAIAAGLMGARVTALDISEVAVDVAQRNVTINHLQERVTVRRGSIDVIRGRKYDLVLANITASVLVDLAPDLSGVLQARAQLLASGIIEERADAVRHAFRAAGLSLEQQARDEDWWLIVAQRTA